MKKNHHNEAPMHKHHTPKKKYGWIAAVFGVAILIILLLGWQLIVDADGDANNGFILLPYLNALL